MIQLSIKDSPITTTKTPCMIVFVGSERKLGSQGNALNKATKNQLKRHLTQIDLPDTLAAWTLLQQPNQIQADQLLIVSYGSEYGKDKTKHISPRDLQKLLNKVDDLISSLHLDQAHLLIDDLPLTKQGLESASRILLQKHYKFDRFKTQSKPSPKTKTRLTLMSQQPLSKTRAALKYAQGVSSGMQLTQDLGNMPGNICTPNYLVQQARALARKHSSLSCTVINETQLAKMGANAFVAVSKGSDQTGQMITLSHKGAKTNKDPIVLVGKGITFDSGGISIKPSAKMDEMKFDMCGAATVFGVMQAVAALKLPINVIGVIAAAENMPSGKATRPGDIVKTLSGQTVEILNTDAEGRLVLCDTLTYVEKFKPKAVIDMATLTGACIVALGHHQSAVLGNNQDLIDKLKTAGEHANDDCWQLPLNKDYEAQIDSEVADMANIGVGGAGTITAAAFLSKFTKKYAWAHLDIAGTAWQKKQASGRPVPLLCQYLREQAGK